MTDEECFEVLRNAAWLGTDHGMSVLNAVESLMKNHELKSKYRWHDLRKNPNDLPDDNDTRSEYVVTDGSQYFTSKYFGKGEYFNGCWEYPDGVFECNAYDVDVIAWREIEPFEEVNE